MGKQINYYMEYDTFACVAEKAVELGCEIIKYNKDHEIVRGYSADLITKDCINYYFHIPEAGEIGIKKVNGRNYVDNGYSASGITLIEAGYSFILPNEKIIRKARLYCITDYYDENGNLIKRPECVTKTYNSLTRYVKKLAPYTELTDTFISMKDDTYLQEIEYKHKEYITNSCLKLRESEYELK